MPLRWGVQDTEMKDRGSIYSDISFNQKTIRLSSIRFEPGLVLNKRGWSDVRYRMKIFFYNLFPVTRANEYVINARTINIEMQVFLETRPNLITHRSIDKIRHNLTIIKPSADLINNKCYLK